MDRPAREPKPEDQPTGKGAQKQQLEESNRDLQRVLGSAYKLVRCENLLGVQAVEPTHEGRKLWTSEYLSVRPPIPPSSLQGGGAYRRKEANHTYFIPLERLQ